MCGFPLPLAFARHPFFGLDVHMQPVLPQGIIGRTARTWIAVETQLQWLLYSLLDVYPFLHYINVFVRTILF